MYFQIIRDTKLIGCIFNINTENKTKMRNLCTYMFSNNHKRTSKSLETLIVTFYQVAYSRTSLSAVGCCW